MLDYYRLEFMYSWLPSTPLDIHIDINEREDDR